MTMPFEAAGLHRWQLARQESVGSYETQAREVGRKVMQPAPEWQPP